MIIDGNSAVAEAIRQINPDVFAGFPITPTSHIMEQVSVYAEKNKIDTELILAESEHSAMSACIGASAGGGRVITATSSQGLSLMNEALFNASGMRLPIVLINGNRALSAPLSIHADHSDINSVRDTGWIILHAKDAQEAYDLTIQATRIAEDTEIRTPVIVAMDGFQVTHTKQQVLVEQDEKIKKFIGKIKEINPLLDVDNPVSYGTATKPDYFTECKRSQLEGLLNARKIIPKIGKEFKENFDRDYTEAGEKFMLDDAEFAIVIMGSLFGTIKEGIKKLRKNGIKIGALRLRTYRPFPGDYVRKKLAHIKKIAIFERTFTAGGEGGPLFNEIKSSLAVACEENNNYSILPFTVGLGGRELFPEHIKDAYEIMNSEQKLDLHEGIWLGIRE